MVRQKSPPKPDSWLAEERPDGVWVSRRLAGGWQVEHRVVLQGATLVVAETRVRSGDDGLVPVGGLSSDLLRRVTLRGAVEAASPLLPATESSDWRSLEALSPAAKRRGEARRWSLTMTAVAYVFAIRDGSRHPNETVAESLGVPVRTVRDRLYAARRARPPLLTGGGRRGVIGEPHLTDAAVAVISDRVTRVTASLGPHRKVHRWQLFQTQAAFDRTYTALIGDAERRMPGLWEMSVEEVAERAKVAPPPRVEMPSRKRLVRREHGLDVVDREDRAR